MFLICDGPTVSIDGFGDIRSCESHLSTVDILPRQSVELLLIKFRPSVDRYGLSQEAYPDLLSCGETQGFVPDGQRDSALDCVIEVPDPIGREKHDPLIILELAKEDRDASVLITVDRARLYEHIRFIQKD